CSDVRDEYQVVRFASDIRRQRFSSLGEQVFLPPTQEFDGLTLELPLEGLIALEDGSRRRTEGAMVQKDDLRVEEKLIAECEAHWEEQYRLAIERVRVGLVRSRVGGACEVVSWQRVRVGGACSPPP